MVNQRKYVYDIHEYWDGDFRTSRFKLFANLKSAKKCIKKLNEELVKAGFEPWEVLSSGNSTIKYHSNSCSYYLWIIRRVIND